MRNLSRPADIAWWELRWPRPLTEEVAARIVRGWATDQRSPIAILEARATGGRISYLLGSPTADAGVIVETIRGLCPDIMLIPLASHRGGVTLAGRLRASTRHRPLSTADLPGQARAVLAGLVRTRRGEELALQVILGPRRIPLAVPSHSPSSMIQPWYVVAWHGNGGQIDSEKRAALRAKVSEPGFACTIRLGATAASPRRRELLLLGLMAALRGSEGPGVQLRLTRESANRLTAAMQPMRWPLRLGVHEVLALTGWPIATSQFDDLPGLPPPHPKHLPPLPAKGKAERVLAWSSTGGTDVPLALSMRQQLMHLHVIGPTGVGKSTMLARLALADIAAGRGLVIIEPKGDLVAEVLERIPDSRRDDVVVLDPADSIAPVGLNPLAADAGRRPEVVVDALLAVFHQLWSDAWGPRTQDILHASLLTLAKRPDATLVMLPLLLTNIGFRRSVTQAAVRDDPIALGSFWGWFDRLSDPERAAVIAPVMNKLRAFLLRPSMRAVLGQAQPRFNLRQVFTENKILLVPLSRGSLGPEAAALLGSLVVADLWQATLERATTPGPRRRPTHVIIDEVQDYLRLPTDLGEALAQARGLGVGFTLAHQYLDQLPKPMQAVLLGNARSRVCFQLAAPDAAVMAKGHPELGAEDLTALGQYEIYASLRREDATTRYVSGRTLPLEPALTNTRALRRQSRERYGQKLSDIEEGFAALHTASHDTGDEPIGRRRRTP